MYNAVQWGLNMCFWPTASSPDWSAVSFTYFFFLCILLKIHVFEVVSTSILAVAILGAHQVGETRAGVMLPFAWVGNLRVGKEGGDEDNLTVKILYLLSNWAIGLKKMLLDVEVLAELIVVVAIPRWLEWWIALISWSSVEINSFCSYQQLFVILASLPALDII